MHQGDIHSLIIYPPVSCYWEYGYKIVPGGCFFSALEPALFNSGDVTVARAIRQFNNEHVPLMYIVWVWFSLTDAVDGTAEYGGEHGERDVGSHGNHSHGGQVGRHVLLGLFGTCNTPREEERGTG